MAGFDDAIFSMDEAAAYAKVSRADLLDWIDNRGLKATPIGSVGKRGPRRYLIRKSWIDANVDAHAITICPVGNAERQGGMKKSRPMPVYDEPVGPVGPRPGSGRTPRRW